MRILAGSLLAFSVVSTSTAFAQSQPASLAIADLVLVHGKVWTGDTKSPEVEAVAVSGSHILAVGTSEAMLKLAAPGAKIIELNGRRVLPGFNDAHVHVTWGGEQVVSVHLTDAAYRWQKS